MHAPKGFLQEPKHNAPYTPSLCRDPSPIRESSLFGRPSGILKPQESYTDCFWDRRHMPGSTARSSIPVVWRSKNSIGADWSIFGPANDLTASSAPKVKILSAALL
jgi:hypothetical protein